MDAKILLQRLHPMTCDAIVADYAWCIAALRLIPSCIARPCPAPRPLEKVTTPRDPRAILLRKMTTPALETAPVLSTPDTHIFEDQAPALDPESGPHLSDEQVALTYE